VRILAVNWLDLANPQAGGAELHFFEIFKRLVAGGDEVTLVTSGFDGASARTSIDGIDVRRCGGRHTFALRGRGAVRRALREKEYDVVVEDINKLPLYLPTLTPLPIYVIVPHLFGTTAFQEASLPVATVVWLSELPIPWVYRSAAFQAISRSTRDDLVSRGIPARRIRVIYPGIDTHRFTPDPEATRAAEPTFFYVGRLRRYKGLETAIRAVAAVRVDIPGIILQIAGDGGDRPRLEALAQSSGVADRVRFLGFITEERKIQLMREAWALVYPSVKEGWGITNLEGAACGTPAIASDSPGLRESVIHDETGLLVPHGDVASMAAAMRRFAGDRPLVNRLGGQARTFAEGLTWAGTAVATRQHLADTIEDHSIEHPNARKDA
jgi:glycosyltransferase involved in cell wall biosynthesis